MENLPGNETDPGSTHPDPQGPLETSLGEPSGSAAELFSSKAILALAFPALGSLIIEPLLILIDSVMVGHLGTTALAGLSLASTVLNTLVGVFVFLAYSTTAVTAHLFGAGKKGAGLQAGIQALWLAAGLGLALVLLLELFAPQLVALLGADPEAAIAATVYLRAGAPGMIGMLVMLAANGVLRGLLDTRTPLVVLAVGATFNVGLNFLLIYGLGLGLLGAGLGLTIAQTFMAAAMVAAVVRAGKGEQVSWRPSRSGVLSAVGSGTPLFIRTVSLRIALLVTVAIAAETGTLALAAHQVVSSIWALAAFALDALAIAAQGLVGVAKGRGRSAELRALTWKLSIWGVLGGVLIGAVVALLSPFLPTLFGPSPQMHEVAATALLVAGIFMPIGGLVFILDGVLIGAGEGPYLAVAGVITLALYLPALAFLHWWVSQSPAPLTASAQAILLAWLWAAFAGWFMLLRALANAWRARHLVSAARQTPRLT